MKFQTPSGGFANGLEPDTLNPNPSPIQTWFAIQYLMDLNETMTQPTHEKINRYLISKLELHPFFQATIPSNNDHPHAPWWHHQDETAILGYNPSVALWAYMVAHDVQSPAKPHLVAAIVDFIDAPKTGMHELKCFVEAYLWLQPIRLSIPNMKAFEAKLFESLLKLLSDFKPGSDQYGPTPLAFIDQPNNRIHELLKGPAQKELSYLKEYILNHEIWPIHFSWDNYPEYFKKAKITWMSIIAIKYLRFFT